MLVTFNLGKWDENIRSTIESKIRSKLYERFDFVAVQSTQITVSATGEIVLTGEKPDVEQAMVEFLNATVIERTGGGAPLQL